MYLTFDLLIRDYELSFMMFADKNILRLLPFIISIR